MKLRQVPAREGFAWARSGLRLVKRQPTGHVAAMMAMSLALGIIASLPQIGLLLVLVLLPALSAGWVYGSASVHAGLRLSPLRLLAPLARSHRVAMLQLGVLHMLAAMLVFWIADWLDPEFRTASRDAMSAGSAASDSAMDTAMEAMRDGMFLRGMMMLPVTLAFWHAPVILHRVGGGVSRAVFASVLATWRNAGAFAVYGLTWLAADLLISSLIGIIASLLGGSQAVLLLILPTALLFGASFYASLHASVHACIEFDEFPGSPVAAPAPAPTSTPAAAPAPDDTPPPGSDQA